MLIISLKSNIHKIIHVFKGFALVRRNIFYLCDDHFIIEHIERKIHWQLY